MTQEELAQRAGISWSQLQKLEYGKSRPTWQTLQGLAQVPGQEVYAVEFASAKTGKPGRPPKKQDKESKR